MLMTTNIDLKKRVAEKRDRFISNLKGLKLSKEFDVNEVKNIISSMEQANLIGEKELANEYKKQVKRYILEHRK